MIVILNERDLITNFLVCTLMKTWLGKYILTKYHIQCPKLCLSWTKVKNFLSSVALCTLYYTLIHCHFSYGLLCWGNSTYINRLFLLQKRAVRIINKKAYRAHTDPLFRCQRILKISDLYKVQALLFTHDYWYNILPPSFQNFYTDGHNVITRRNAQKILYTERPRTNFSQNLVYHNAASIWNRLDNNIKSIESRINFKNAISRLFLDDYLGHVVCNNDHCPDCSH